MTPTKHYLAMLRQEAELAMTNKVSVTIKGEYLLELLDLIDEHEDEVREFEAEITALRNGDDYER